MIGPSIHSPLRAFSCALAVGVACTACSHRTGPAPAVPQPIPYADTLPIPEPRATDPYELRILLREWIRGEANELSLREAVSGPSEALNVTAFDEVVPSAWYEHRVTAGESLSPEEVRRGPPGEPPASSGPLTVVDGKLDGVTPGFTVEDERGNRYLLKFDPPAYPALTSGADAVTSRLFWAAGYHVPHDAVIDVDPARLVLGEGATAEAAEGERPLTVEDVETALERTGRRPDGTVRALASLFVPGTPKGPFRFEGTREDDPNDYYPHEHRRELRGVWVLSAWLNNVDLRFANTLDTFIEPTGYLRHYLIDFGTTLGSGAIRPLNPREGVEYAFDPGPFFARWATLGLYRVGWEGVDGTPIHPSLGWMSAERFDPGAWKPFTGNASFRNLTVRDGYWGAKRVAALSPDHVRAAVVAGRYPREAADTLEDILLLRRRKVIEHWYGQVTPAERLAARWAPRSPEEPAVLELSFVDGGLSEGVWRPEESVYRWAGRAGSVDVRGGSAAAGEGLETSGRITLLIPIEGTDGGGGVPGGDDASGWLELEVAVDRPRAAARPALVRIEWAGSATPRVTGVIY